MSPAQVAQAIQIFKGQKKLGKNKKMKTATTKVKKIIKKKQNKSSAVKPAIAQQLDDRNPIISGFQTDNSMSNTQSALTLETAVNVGTFQGIALSVVSYALSRGWDSYTSTPDIPYFAYIYLTNTLINYANDAVPQMSSVPRWLAIWGSMIGQKRVPFYAGAITYKFNTGANTAVLSVTENVGPTAAALQWNCSKPTNAVVNTRFIITDNVTPAYTSDLGESAASSLFQFMQSDRGGNKEMDQMVPSNGAPPARVKVDASAYATVTTQLGGGQESGGWLTSLSLEVPIRSPIFSIFLMQPSNLTNTIPGRFSNYPRSFSGDVLSNAGLSISYLHPKQLSMKQPIKYHFVDFFEFSEVVALWLGQVIEQRFNDPDEMQNYNIAGGAGLNPTASANWLQSLTCPLTFQEVNLLLRATLMNAVKDTQPAVQSLYPREDNGSYPEFAAFVAGFGTGPRAMTTEMKLPRLLLENIRNLTSKINDQHRNGANNPYVSVPVLGGYPGDVLPYGDAVVIIPALPSDDPGIPIFSQMGATPSFYHGKRVNAKGVIENIMAPETPISLYDGSSTAGYIIINDPGPLNTLVSIWNTWIVQNVEQFSVAIDVLGTENGIALSRSVNVTRYWQDVSVDSPALQFVDPRIKKATLTPSYYASRQEDAVSFSYNPYSSVWETYQQFYILPQVRIDHTTIITNQSDFTRVSGGMREPFSLAANETAMPKNFQESHASYASLLTRQKLAVKTSIENFLDEAARKGRGGILTSLLAGPLDKALGTGGLLSGLASVLPI